MTQNNIEPLVTRVMELAGKLLRFNYKLSPTDTNNRLIQILMDVTRQFGYYSDLSLFKYKGNFSLDIKKSSPYPPRQYNLFMLWHYPDSGLVKMRVFDGDSSSREFSSDNPEFRDLDKLYLLCNNVFCVNKLKELMRDNCDCADFSRNNCKFQSTCEMHKMMSQLIARQK